MLVVAADDELATAPQNYDATTRLQAITIGFAPPCFTSTSTDVPEILDLGYEFPSLRMNRELLVH